MFAQPPSCGLTGNSPQKVDGRDWQAGNRRTLSSLARCAIVAICGLAAWAMFLPATASRAYVYTWDSAAYVECARSMLEGNGFLQRRIDGLNPEIWQPIAWWPPGYPILIALASAVTGIGAPQAGVGVAMVSAAAAILLIANILCKLVNWIVAIPVLCTIVWMPSFQQISVTCMSDATYLMLVAACVSCILEWQRRGYLANGWLLSAGVLAGMSWGVRYAAVAFLAATTICIVISVPLRRELKPRRCILVWLLGMAIGLFPFVIRNVLAFDRAVAYDMNPSDLSLRTNIRAAARVVIEDMTSSVSATNVIADNGVLGLAAIGGVVLVLLFIRYGRTASSTRQSVGFDIFTAIMFAFVICHLGLVIATRTKYLWGEPIVSRHCCQTYWMIWTFLAVVGTQILRAIGIPGRATLLFMLALFGLTAAVQLRSLASSLRTAPGLATSLENTFGVRGASQLAQLVPANQIVFSNYPELLRIHFDVNARKIPDVPYFKYLPPLTREDLLIAGEAGWLWGVVIADVPGVRAGRFGPMIQELEAHPENFPEFDRIDIDGPATAFRFVGSRPGR